MKSRSFLNETVRERLRRNPTFFPPDMQSMLAYDLPTRADPPRRQVGSHCFDALVYQRALFPLMPGRFSIPPAQLVYSLPLSASFFSREETHELQTDSTVIVAIEPPTQGRPADYGGAVGNLRVAAKLDTVASRVGDPMRLTVRVSGTGNVKLFPRPADRRPVGLAREGRRTRPSRHDGASHRRREGIRLGAHAEDRRRAGSSADPLPVLQPGIATLRDGDHRQSSTCT